MSNPERQEDRNFSTQPPSALDLTVEQALEHIEEYLPGGEKFVQGTSDRITKLQENPLSPSSNQE